MLSFFYGCADIALVVTVGIFVTFDIGISKHVAKYDDCENGENY